MGSWSEWLQAISERSPERARWLVRVFRTEAGAEPVGAGVLVDGRRVLTCAHVAAPKSSPAPASVWIDFPFLPDSRRQEATLAPDGWEPLVPGGRGDLGLFELAALPPGAVPAPLRRPGRVSGHAFAAYGFPPGHTDGVWAVGTLLGAAGPGHIQLEVEEGHAIERGFSGAPVWDAHLQALIGLVATAELGTRRSFLIPMSDASRRWPMLEGWVGWRASQDVAFMGHWLPAALGGNETTEQAGRPASLFTGRHQALGELGRWLEAPADGKVKVVTGLPGTGKSALLSRLIVLADPLAREQLSLSEREGATAPAPFAFDVAVHARQRTIGDVASAIAQTIGAPLDVTSTEWARPVEAAARAVVAIAAAPRERKGTLTIAVDALDEAYDPLILARLLLQPLARQEGIRLAVATRPGHDDRLLRALGVDRSEAMVLHDSPWFSLSHLEDYVRAGLMALHGSEPPWV